MNAQQIFDTVVAHLRQQQIRAFCDERAACVYLNADGTKCAVGCLIESSEYDPRFEDAGLVGNLLQQDYVPASLKERLRPHLNLLMQLQAVHDSNRNDDADYREEMLQRAARNFALVYNPPVVK